MALGGVLIGWTGVSNLFLLIYNIQITPTLLVLLPAIPKFNKQVQHLEGLTASALEYADYADNLHPPHES